MKFGLRTPSLKRRISARTSWKRVVRHRMGIKAPRGLGILTNPKKALYNKVYNKTTVSVDDLIKTSHKRKNIPTPHKGNMNNRIGIETSNTGKIIRSSSKALTVTSKNFKKLRQEITDIYNKRVELLKQLKTAKLKLYFFTAIHLLSYILIIGFFYKKIAELRESQQNIKKKLEDKLSETYVKLTFADKSQLEKSWLNCFDAFTELMGSEKIWDLTYAENVDRVKARTVAKTAIKRTLLPKGVEKQVEFIKSDLTPLFLSNNNGPDLFFFPTFLLLYKGSKEFGIFDLKDIETKMNPSAYIEEEKVPTDAEIIEQTWKKTNKNGSMDKRFKDNYQIPVVKYGSLALESGGGLEESFMFSNFDVFSEFAQTYEYHLKLLNKL